MAKFDLERGYWASVSRLGWYVYREGRRPEGVCIASGGILFGSESDQLKAARHALREIKTGKRKPLSEEQATD